MAKVLWQIPFKSFNGISCRVDIYDPTVPESTPISPQIYKGAEDPFYFEEDNSDDLLNDVLRYQTGYIRMIDDGTMYIPNIYPTSTFDRPVKVWYGSTMIFNGYIQLQDFSSLQVPTPKVIELPVISTLGLMDHKNFSNTLYPTPSEVSLGAVLDIILNNTDYEYVYLPKDYGVSVAYNTPVNLGMKINTLVVTPWNENYHYSMSVQSANKVMRGQTHEYIVEAICKAFGWICHDTPNALVFTAFDYDGDYCSYPAGHIGDSDYQQTVSIPAATDLTTFFMNIDNRATIQTLQPDTGIEISYEGELGDRTFSFAHMHVPEQNPVVIQPSSRTNSDIFPNHAEIFSLCSLLPVSYLWETNVDASPTFIDNPQAQYYDKVNFGMYCVAWAGREGVLLSLGDRTSGDKIFWLRFYIRKRTGQKFSISYDMLLKKSGDLGQLYHSPDQNVDYYIQASVDADHDYYVEVGFSYFHTGQGGQYPVLDHGLVFIYNITLEVCEQGVPYESYLYKPANANDIVAPDGTSDYIIPKISSSIKMPISLYRLTDNMIGSTVRTTRVTNYPYLFQQRKEFTGKFRLVSAPSLIYARIFNYFSKKWRVIAQEFHPWNDEMRLTMQHSPILTNFSNNE